MILAVPLFHLGALAMSEQYEYRRTFRTGRIADPRIVHVQGRQLRQALAQVKGSYQRRTGALEKREPLPAGRYWIDVFGDKKVASFLAWQSLHADTVKVKKTEVYDNTSDSWLDLGIDVPVFDSAPSGIWSLFEVEAPTTWGLATTLGWPSIAGANIQSSQDTIQKPDPPKNIWDDGISALPGWLPWAIAGGVGLAVLTIVLRR